MCGIFGGASQKSIDQKKISSLARAARQRGRDSSGIIFFADEDYVVPRADFDISRLLGQTKIPDTAFVAGHSRLITNGHNDNQPVIRSNIAVIHNGIITNTDEIWADLNEEPRLQIDSEVLPAVASALLESGVSVEEIPDEVIRRCKGVVSMVIVFPRLGKMALASNNGSLYVGEHPSGTYFSSESFPLTAIGCENVNQVFSAKILNIPASDSPMNPTDLRVERTDLVPALPTDVSSHELLNYDEVELVRCTRCILPETMPFISFDEEGVCNYCHNYTPRNNPRDPAELEEILARYRRDVGRDCIFPFSGGRDSSFGLHLAVEKFGLKPIAYTYDWGMVTDLGRRNISRMCASLGVENIIVAADIQWKRSNIRKNLQAWLKAPHLGMISILTAGDKHFFKHVETVKKQTGISLNLWSINPLEVTHFKAGFLGVAPNFAEKRVYQSGLAKQLRYHRLRFGAMVKSPGYFNSSLYDTLSGEYYRSRSNKADYYHLFDYWRWDEQEIDDTLVRYGWERAPDTTTTWRIGDGTAAFYNYVYHRVAGFTEHDTFRSNQIREGDISRDEGLALAKQENEPRYQNIKWYLDAVGLDFEETIERVNWFPRLTGGANSAARPS